MAMHEGKPVSIVIAARNECEYKQTDICFRSLSFYGNNYNEFHFKPLPTCPHVNKASLAKVRDSNYFGVRVVFFQ